VGAEIEAADGSMRPAAGAQIEAADDGSMRLAAGAGIVFRYRLILHVGDAGAARIADRYREYAR